MFLPSLGWVIWWPIVLFGIGFAPKGALKEAVKTAYTAFMEILSKIDWKNRGQD